MTNQEYDREAEQQARLEAKRKEEWAKMCPVLYDEIDLSKIPQQRLEMVMNWDYELDGNLWLCGGTGLYKTTLAYAKLRRLHFSGVWVHAVHSLKLNNLFGIADGEQREKEIERLSKYKVLLIDDLGKEPPTQQITAGIALLIEIRYSKNKPFIITSNDATRTSIEGTIDSSTYRRLTEKCKFLNFDRAKK